MGSPLPVKVDYCLFCLCGAPSSKSRKGGAPFFIAKKRID